MQKLILASLVFMLAVPSFGADRQNAENNNTFYAIGLVVARQLSIFNLTPAELESVKKGIMDGVSDKTPLVNLDDYRGKIQELANARRNKYGEKLSALSKELLSKAAAEKGAIRTKSGLIFLSEKEGQGTSPTLADNIVVNYRGTLADGKEFDSSYKRGQPADFQFDKMISCWKEGLQMMKPGGKARLLCPPETAYGERGNAYIPPNAALIFDIELLEVKKQSSNAPDANTRK